MSRKHPKNRWPVIKSAEEFNSQYFPDGIAAKGEGERLSPSQFGRTMAAHSLVIMKESLAADSSKKGN